MSFDPVIALLGAKALYLLYIWLLGCVAASYLSGRKGYGEKAGMATGLLLPVVSIVIWLVWPAKRDSRWKLQGAFGSGGRTAAEARAELEKEEGLMAPDGNPTALYFPLLLLGLLYGVLYVSASAAGTRGGPEAQERMLDVAFGVALLAVAYTLVLLIISIFTLPDLVVDLVRIVLVVSAFFGLLLGVLFGVFELLINAGRRTRRVQPVADRSADSSSG